MREITPALTPALQEHVGKRSVALAPAFPVHSYRELVEHVAQLSYLNKDHLLFYRGQAIDFQTRNGASSFYPSIYRGDYTRRDVIEDRYGLLRAAGKALHNLCAIEDMQ